MQAVFEAAKVSVAETCQAVRSTEVYKEECLKLGRYVSKVTLILAELELMLSSDESLLGSESMFLAAEAVLAALQQAQSLVKQCCSTSAARIWPLEDAIEFQSVALELYNAISKVAAVNFALPHDVKEDLDHFKRQLRALQFTETELEESEDIEFAAVQLSARKARETAKENEKQAETEGGTPTGAISNIKPFRPGAAPACDATIATAEASPDADESWEALEEEQEDEEQGENVSREGEEEEEEEGFEIPPPDEGLIELLDKQGVAYVSLDDSKTTALPPGFPVKGAQAKEDDNLPSDPFSMQEGAQAQVEEGARLASTALRELSALKSS